MKKRISEIATECSLATCLITTSLLSSLFATTTLHAKPIAAKKQQSANTLNAVRQPSGGWMSLHGGCSAELLDTWFTYSPDLLNADFKTFDETPNPVESGHAAAVIFNDCGLLVVIKLKSAESDLLGKTDIYFETGSADENYPPKHVTINPPQRADIPMKPEFFGAAIPIEARNRPNPTTYHVTEEKIEGGALNFPSINREFKIMRGKEKDTWYITKLIWWNCVAYDLPFHSANNRGISLWKIKIIRKAKDGTKYVFGQDVKPYSGYAVLRWPKFSNDAKASLYRQLIISGVSGKAGEILSYRKEYWTVSAAESEYRFLKPPYKTFQAREEESDKLFYENYLEKFCEKNNKMIDSLAYSSEKGAKAFDWPIEEKDRFFKNDVKRLFTFERDIAEMRRLYLLDQLLGRKTEATTANPKEKPKKESTPSVNAFEMIDDGDMLQLDDVDFF